MPFLRVINANQDTNVSVSKDDRVIKTVPYDYEVITGYTTGLGGQQLGGTKITQYGLQIFYLENGNL
jgi:hypothetical protein